MLCETNPETKRQVRQISGICEMPPEQAGENLLTVEALLTPGFDEVLKFFPVTVLQP